MTLICFRVEPICGLNNFVGDLVSDSGSEIGVEFVEIMKLETFLYLFIYLVIYFAV